MHHSYNIRSWEMLSTSTNSQEEQTYVALSCGINGLEGNAIGVSISIDMFKRTLIVLLKYCSKGGSSGFRFADFVLEVRCVRVEWRRLVSARRGYPP